MVGGNKIVGNTGYFSLSEELVKRIEADRRNHIVNPYAFKDENIVRRNMDHDKANLWRPAFVRDVEKIMHVPYYNRYSDKTQVFSLYRNDDITRRSQHVQLVSRIARNIGSLLGLNTDLIEAISLGHDIGHTPFGHAGETALSKAYNKRTGRIFKHNIHSARVLDKICLLNLSLQTLDGIICHNGERELDMYRPQPYSDFTELDRKIEECCIDKDADKRLIPATLEGCVMRVSDIIAYLGKDRQDAKKLGIVNDDSYETKVIGTGNAEIINNLIVNIVENSYGKDYICMSEDVFQDFAKAKDENYKMIYMPKTGSPGIAIDYVADELFENLYAFLRDDYESKGKDSYLNKYHIDYIKNEIMIYRKNKYAPNEGEYDEVNSVDDMVMDYIAGMTDDYFIEIYNKVFPDNTYNLHYKGYFD